MSNVRNFKLNTKGNKKYRKVSPLYFLEAKNITPCHHCSRPPPPLFTLTAAKAIDDIYKTEIGKFVPLVRKRETFVKQATCLFGIGPRIP